MQRVLFVCTGNICRSPTAEGVFRHLVAEAGLSDGIGMDSVGLEGWHVGNPPDPRSVEAAARRGVDMSDLRARQLTLEDFDRFDLLLAMDEGHHRDMQRRATREQRDKVRMFMEAVAGYPAPAVPDPYYGGSDGFESVLDMIEEGARAWLRELEARAR
ncbi:MAG: low molecular weight phosphotyrosine protein phosphatase [Alphaproteobacteria bacterium]|nr:low molecular weight phosphotyrosine protein phosphatase [Alphaproteobacteria bacterium]